MQYPEHIEPVAGNWYRSRGQLFEVVAIDDAEQLIETQHADGDLGEIEFDDWATRCRAGSLHSAEAPEDPALANEREDDDESWQDAKNFDEVHGGLHADNLEDLDLFE